MDRLSADRLFIGSLTVDKTQWEVRGQVLGPEGTRLSSVAAQVPPNDLHGLASQLAQRLATRLGLNVIERPPVTLSAMAPYARAQASLNAGEPNAAARALETADPRPGTTLNSAKEVVEDLAANQNLPAPSRMQLSLLSGDNAGARHTADEILKVEPKNVQARAGKVRALANQGELDIALKEFDEIKGSKDPLAAVANMQLLIKRRHAPDRAALAQGHLSEDAQAEALAMTMNDPDSDNQKTLAFVSAAGPNALPPEVEMAAVGAAERVATKDPALASSVATRALKGGVAVDRALPLAKVETLDKSEVAAVKDKLEALGPKGETAMKALGQELEKREGAAQKLRLGGVEMPIADSALAPLANQLRALLGHFGVLQEQMGPRAMVVAKQDTDARWWKPFWVRRPRLERGLLRAMWDKPYEMGLVVPPADATVVTAANLTETHLGNLLDRLGADLVVVHSEQPRGMDVEVELILFDGASGTAYRTSGKVAGMSNSLLSVNAIPFGILGLVIALPIGFLRMRRRVGEIIVKVQAADTTDRMLCVLISQSAKPPRVTDTNQFTEEMNKLGQKKDALSASLVEALTSFERVKPGIWYVHLYGIYRTGKITHILAGEEYSQRVEVKQQKEHTVLFDITISSAEFHVTVHDKKSPLVGVPVWVDDARDKAVKTNDDGLAVLKVGMGQHKLRVEAAGMLVEKNHVVVKRKAHLIAINLDWERKRDDVSRALDNDPDVIAARSSATMPLQPGSSSAVMRAQRGSSSAVMPVQPAGSSATMPAQPAAAPQPADEGISLGLELDIPPPAAKPPADLAPVDRFAPPSDHDRPPR
jgi:hypothetical protein